MWFYVLLACVTVLADPTRVLPDAATVSQLLATARVDDVLRPGFFNRFVRNDKNNKVEPSFDPAKLHMDIPFKGVPPGWDIMERNKANFMAETLQSFQSVAMAASNLLFDEHGKPRNMGPSINVPPSAPKSVSAPVPKQIKILPEESVHFGDRATCILHMEVLHLVNVGDDPVEFFDVVIDNSFFHHSFKNTISVAPRGNLTV